MAAVHFWIMYNQIRREKTPFSSFLVTLPEELLAEGRKNTSVYYVKKNITFQKLKLYGNVSLSLPIEGQTSRSFSRCSKKQQQEQKYCLNNAIYFCAKIVWTLSHCTINCTYILKCTIKQNHNLLNCIIFIRLLVQISAKKRMEQWFISLSNYPPIF